jgi:hypothetical protein
MGERGHSLHSISVRLAAVSFGALLTLVILASVFAGGFGLAVEATEAENQSMKDVALIVRTYGCHHPADAVVTATAEGIVDNHRQSMPVDLKADEKGVYTIRRQWPSEGKWVLVLTGTDSGMTSTVFVQLDEKGGVYADTRLTAYELTGTHARALRRKPTSGDIEAALKSNIGAIAMAAPSSTSVPPAILAASGAGAFLLLFGIAALGRRRRQVN